MCNNDSGSNVTKADPQFTSHHLTTIATTITTPTRVGSVSPSLPPRPTSQPLEHTDQQIHHQSPGKLSQQQHHHHPHHNQQHSLYHHHYHPPQQLTSVRKAMLTSTTTTAASAVPPGLLPLDHYRLQLYNYAMAERLRCGQYTSAGNGGTMCPTYPSMMSGPYGPRLALSMSLFHNRVFQPEEPKPQHSYIGLIAMAILSTADHKLVLSDIYQHILDNYPYFRSRGPGWRNSIRHNLSLNDCFVKAGRSANGKGHYWAIHPANLDDFQKGDFRRRKAQRKVRKHMGLAVDDEGTDSPSPPPASIMDATRATPPPPLLPAAAINGLQGLWGAAAAAAGSGGIGIGHHTVSAMYSTVVATTTTAAHSSATRKRQFDVASLLAPDDESMGGRFAKPLTEPATHHHHHHQQYHHLYHLQSVKRLSIAAAAAARGTDIDEDIDVEANDDLYADRHLDSPRSCSGGDGGGRVEDGSHNEDERYAATGTPPVLSPSSSNLDAHNHHQQHPSHHQQQHRQHPSETGDVVEQPHSTPPSWHGIMQQWPTGFSQQLDPRILGRYYGQYMAAAQHASRRLSLGDLQESSSNSSATNAPATTL